MSNTIALAVDLPATPARLYRMYLDPTLHAAFTGFPVRIAARAGTPFLKGGLKCTEINLVLLDPARITQQS